jgi:Domain of unknown function (DUF4392)
MGKAIAAVRTNVPLGDTIGCVTAAHSLIVAGVSNWGGYGLAAAVAVLSFQAGSPSPAFVPTRDEELSLFRAIGAAAICLLRVRFHARM